MILVTHIFDIGEQKGEIIWFRKSAERYVVTKSVIQRDECQ